MEKVRVIFNCKPFVINQCISVFNESNTLIDRINTTMISAERNILSLKSRYDIIRIDLCGNKKFLSKLQKTLQDNLDSVPVEIAE